MTITIETKFSKGDEVWYIFENQICTSSVREILIRDTQLRPGRPFNLVYHTDLTGSLPESELFATQQELIDYLTYPANVQRIDPRLVPKPA